MTDQLNNNNDQLKKMIIKINQLTQDNAMLKEDNNMFNENNCMLKEDKTMLT